MQKLVKSFSDANTTRIVPKLDFESMGRDMLKRFVTVATSIIEQMPLLVVFENDQGPQRLIFSGSPHPEVRTFDVRWEDTMLTIPAHKYYSNDLQKWVYRIDVPTPDGTTPEMAYQAMSDMCPVRGLFKLKGDTVYLEK